MSAILLQVMLSCYGTNPDDETVKLMAEELVRKHQNELKEEEAGHERATVSTFTHFLKRNSYDKNVAYNQWKEFIK